MAGINKLLLCIAVLKPLWDNLYNLAYLIHPDCPKPATAEIWCPQSDLMWYLHDLRFYALAAVFSAVVAIQVPRSNVLGRYLSTLLAVDCCVDLGFLLANGDQKSAEVGFSVYLIILFYGLISDNKRQRMESRGLRKIYPDTLYSVVYVPAFLHGYFFRSRRRLFYMNGVVSEKRGETFTAIDRRNDDPLATILPGEVLVRL